MRVLVACEFSGTVRDAFVNRGHDAWSCDLWDSYTIGNHIMDDVLKHLNDGWDLMIAHPPCRFLTVANAGLFSVYRSEQNKALEFVKALLNAPIHRIALENPIGVISTRIRKPDQIIQPWMFGHGETKATCLWLKNLPKLLTTKISGGRVQRIHYMSPSQYREKLRSITYKGIADAMADQWGNLNPLWNSIVDKHCEKVFNMYTGKKG